MAFTFPAMVAWDNGSNTAVKNAVFQVYATSDTGFASPLTITDSFGNPLAGNYLRSGAIGTFAQFQQATNSTVVISDPAHIYAWTISCAPTDASTANLITQPLTAAALNAAYAPKGAGSKYLADATPLRELVRRGAITAAAPMVPIGDSHTDITTSAQYIWARMQSLGVLPGQGLENMDPAAIVAKGLNGQLLSNYLANPAQTGGYNAAIALNPSVILACWLTNDVRQGGLGLTVAAIRAAGAALLSTLIASIERDAPKALVVLRVATPYTTVNTGTDNYISDGAGNINPAGLAQIYTDGVRLANYDAAAANPGVIVYDPQTRFFGTVSPTANGGSNSGYYANQIHQNQKGYQAEADDFVAWVAAQAPYNQAATDEARNVQNPSTPWAAYYRALEDTSRYVKVADAPAVTVTAGNAYLDFGPAFPGAIPGNIAKGDIICLYGARVAWQPTTLPPPFLSGSNTRISGLVPTVPASAGQYTRVAVYRKISTPDDLLNVILNDGSYQYKRTGMVQAGSTSYVDMQAVSYSASPALNASTWATQLQAGDVVNFEEVPSLAHTAAIGTTATSTTVTGLFTAADVGRDISGTGIAAGSYIVSQTGTAAVLSIAATATGTPNATIGAITLVIGTDTTSNNASGASTRLQGPLRGIDWSTKVGKALIVTGAHP